jgi:hypothetical protein
MGAELAAKLKARLPLGAAAGAGSDWLPPTMPRQREPFLYPFKMPLAVSTISALVIVALSPWPRYQWTLWVLVGFVTCSLFGVIGQAIRMVTVVSRYRRLYVCGGHASAWASACSAGPLGGLGATGVVASSFGAAGGAAAVVGKDVGVPGAKVVIVEAPLRPGHKKALRAKGHRSNVSLDAIDGCCDQSGEAVSLVIDCEDWSDSSGSGSDWAAGPPRWNHVFVIPNYKEVRAVNALLPLPLSLP